MKKTKKTNADHISDLLEYAQKGNMIDGAFDNEIDDTCDDAAQLMAE